VALGAGGKLQNLALESAHAHPDLPVLVTALTEAEAEAATDVIAQARNVVLAETVTFTPRSQPSQGHRIQCAWNLILKSASDRAEVSLGALVG